MMNDETPSLKTNIQQRLYRNTAGDSSHSSLTFRKYCTGIYLYCSWFDYSELWQFVICPVSSAYKFI